MGLFSIINRLRVSPRTRRIAEFVALFMVLAVGLSAFFAALDLARTRYALEGEIAELRARLFELEIELMRVRERPRLMYNLPDSVSFAGQLVPLDSTDVRERIETEMLLYLDKPGQIMLMRKRAAQLFPTFEGILAVNGLPADLKYLSVVESALRPDAVSWAEASGYWQFIPGTAARYGLRVGEYVDERNTLELATSAASKYLKDLHRMFGDWFLAMAAYNCGEGGVFAARRDQGRRSFWDLQLPRETEKYVPRIIAVKVIFENLDRYVAPLEPGDGFEYVSVPVELHFSRSITLADLARTLGVPVRELTRYNPHLLKTTLPPGDYWISVPERAVEKAKEAYGA